MKRVDRVDAIIAGIVVANFAYLIFGIMSPSWRTMSDYLKSIGLASADVFAALALTVLLFPLLAIQFSRRKSSNGIIRWKIDVLLVAAWVVTLGLVALTHLPMG